VVKRVDICFVPANIYKKKEKTGKYAEFNYFRKICKKMCKIKRKCEKLLNTLLRFPHFPSEGYFGMNIWNCNFIFNCRRFSNFYPNIKLDYYYYNYYHHYKDAILLSLRFSSQSVSSLTKYSPYI